MVSVESIMEKLAQMGSDQTKKVLMRHGAREPFYGVKVQDLKKIVGDVRKNARLQAHQLALDLFATGNSDAMYLAGLLADPKQMTRDKLQEWAQQAYWYMISDFTVAWVASESPYGLEMAMNWIDSEEEMVASAGWNTLGSIVAITPDADLDLELLKSLIERVRLKIHGSQNRVRHSMNHFLIAVGTYVIPLTETCKSTALGLGKITVDMGGTACKVPYAPDYLDKVKTMGRIGKKRKGAVC